MKEKLNLTIDKELIPQCKAYARSHGISVSKLVETLLRETTEKDKQSFSGKWRGRFKPTKHRGPRYDVLKERFLK